jgi:hypothetical protein
MPVGAQKRGHSRLALARHCRELRIAYHCLQVEKIKDYWAAVMYGVQVNVAVTV